MKICPSTCIHTHYQAIVEKVSRFGQARKKQDEKGRKIGGSLLQQHEGSDKEGI